MMDNLTNAWLSLFLWSFIPSLVSRFMLSTYYRFKYDEASARPKPKSATYRRHYFNVLCLVLFGYFVYCVTEAMQRMPPNYYKKIGIRRARVSEDLKPRFRQLVMQMHPDKVPNADLRKFLEVRHIYEVLDSEDLRCCYEVFGQDVLESTNSSSKRNKNSSTRVRDFLDNAFMNWLVYYIGSIGVLFFLSIVNLNFGLYWRLVGIFGFGALELFIITRPDRWAEYDLLSRFPIISNYTFYEQIVFLRAVIVNGLVMVSQILSFGQNERKVPATKELVFKLNDLITQVLSKQLDTQTSDIVAPFKDDPEAMKRFQTSLGKALTALENTQISD